MERKNNELYLEMIRIIKGKKPKYFIAENVPGILSLGGYRNIFQKKKKEGRIMEVILQDLKKIGYNEKNFPNSFKYYHNALTIPLFYDLSDEQQAYIIKQVKKLIG